MVMLFAPDAKRQLLNQCLGRLLCKGSESRNVVNVS